MHIRSRNRNRSRYGGDFFPGRLFLSGAQGAWYDPSDYSTLFQNNAGNVPVTAVEQPVRLMLDRSRGLVLGSELITNGDFSNGTTGWTAAGGTTISVDTQRLRVQGGAAYQSVSTVAGRWYLLTLDITVSDPGGIYIGTTATGASSSDIFTSGQIAVSGQRQVRFRATTATTFINVWAWNAGSTFCFYDNISVRELPGNHAVAPNDASRPILRATNRLDFDGSDDRMAAAAGGGGTTGMLFVAGINLDVLGSASTIWSDTGTNTGYRVRINASNEVELSAGNGSAYTTVTTAETLASGTNYVIAAWHDGTNLNTRLGLGGAIAQTAFATATAGTAAFTVGMDNGATSSFLNGKLYNVVYVRNFAGTLSDVEALMRYVNGKLT